MSYNCVCFLRGFGRGLLRTLRGENWIRSKRKRAFDFCLLAIIWVPAACIALFSALAIWTIYGGPILFRQKRIGRDGKIFTIHKFRTTPVGSQELTCLGELLNVLGADETPQILYDIGRGVMGVIGARPLIPQDFPKMRAILGRHRYRKWYRAYTACRPGWMSAFSQPSRTYIAQSPAYLMARYRYEVWYFKHASPRVDLAIFFRSLTMWCTDMPRLVRAIYSFCKFVIINRHAGRAYDGQL